MMFWLEIIDQDGDIVLVNLERFDSIVRGELRTKGGEEGQPAVLAWNGEQTTALFTGTKEECEERFSQISRLMASIGLGKQIQQDEEEKKYRELMHQQGSLSKGD